MYLDEYGLWRWHSPEEAVLEFQSQSNADTGGTQERPAESDAGDAPAAATGSGYWELVEGESEERILDELELGAIAPQRRNFRFLKKKERATARNGRLDFSPAEVGMEEGEG
jgi:DNA polymerase beta